MKSINKLAGAGAFTLAEMVVVMTIIAMLTGTAILHLQAIDEENPFTQAQELQIQAEKARLQLIEIRNQIRD